jgi:outer membrane protein OmpA-like peptidoglycan-associated protein
MYLNLNSVPKTCLIFILIASSIQVNISLAQIQRIEQVAKVKNSFYLPIRDLYINDTLKYFSVKNRGVHLFSEDVDNLAYNFLTDKDVYRIRKRKSDGEIYAMTINQVESLNDTTKTFKILNVPSESIVNDFDFDVNYLWITTNKELIILALEEETEIAEDIKITEDIINNEIISLSCIYIDNYRNKWIGAKNGLYKIKSDNTIDSDYDYEFKEIKVNCLLPEDNNLWIAGRDIKTNEGRLLYFSKNRLTRVTIPSEIDEIIDIKIDIEGNLWIVASSLFKYDFHMKRVIHRTILLYGDERIYPSKVAIENDSSIWLGSENLGLFHLKHNPNNICNLRSGQNAKINVNFIQNSDSIDNFQEANLLLQNISNCLLNNLNLKIAISGHTSGLSLNKQKKKSSKEIEKNELKMLSLSQKRADKVKDILKLFKVPEKQILYSKGYGSTVPLCKENNTLICKRENMRVTITFKTEEP